MAKLKKYNGSVQLMAGITQKGGGDFALIEANAVQTQEDGKRLDEELKEIKETIENLPTGGGGTVNGDTEANPNTLAQRNEYGSLFGANNDFLDDTANIDDYIEEDELINAKTLKAYAVPKPSGTMAREIGVYVHDGDKTVIYHIDTDGTSFGSDVIPTAHAVFERVHQLDNKVVDNYATKELLWSEIDDMKSHIDEAISEVVLPEGTNILYGTDATGETWGYKIAQDIPGVESDSDSIINTMILSNALYTKQDVLEVGNNLDLSPTKDSMNPVTSGGVYGRFESYKDDLSLIFATSGELEGKQDKLTFDDRAQRGSSNPITSGGVKTEIEELSLYYDGAIDNAKSESKEYTDTKITELSSNFVTSEEQERYVTQELTEFEVYMDEKHASKEELNTAIQQAILDSWEEEV